MKNLLAAAALALPALTLGSAAVYAESLLITNATLHTMGDKGVIESADILIDDGKITRIADRIATNKSIPVINAEGRLVTPAFFAGVTVSGLSEVEAVSEAVDSRIRELYTGIMHPEFDVRTAYTPHASVIPITRIEGFGYTLLSASSSDRSISGTGGLVRFDGGYDSFEGHGVIYVDIDGQSADHVGGSRAAHWMLLEQAFVEMRAGDDDLDLINATGQRVMRSTQRNGVFVFKANRASDIMQVVKFAKNHKIDAAILGGREAWMVADTLAAAEIPVMINALDNLPADFDSLGARLDNASLLEAAGVTIMFTSGETHNARKVRQIAGNAVSYGLDHSAALAALTTTPARVFGGSSRVLATGAQADLVIWSGDPLEVTSAADVVIIGGKADSMQSRQTLLRDRYLPTAPDMPRAYINP